MGYEMMYLKFLSTYFKRASGRSAGSTQIEKAAIFSPHSRMPSSKSLNKEASTRIRDKSETDKHEKSEAIVSFISSEQIASVKLIISRRLEINDNLNIF